MRVSDAERQAAAERLRGALAEGRLDFAEYDVRLAKAFEAVTYADLDRLFTDLPVAAQASSVPAVAAPGLSPPRRAGPRAWRVPAVAAPSRPAGPRPVPAVRTGAASLPLALKIL